MNKILISASAVIALFAGQAQAEATVGGGVELVNKATATDSSTYGNVNVYVDGSAGRFYMGRSDLETHIGYSNSFGNTSGQVEYNITTEVGKVALSHSIDPVSFGFEAKTNEEWNVWGRYQPSPYYVGVKYDHADVITLSGGASFDGVSVDLEANTNDEWKIGVGYAKDKYSVAAAYEHDGDHKLEGGFAINENYKLSAGYYMEDAGATEKTKVGVSFQF